MRDIVSESVTALSSVANNLINKISSAIGWVFMHDTPNRIAVKSYIEELEKSKLPALQKAALISRAKKDIKEYANQCCVVNGAFQYLDETAKPEELEEDWVAQFFDKVRLVSNEEFQLIWSRLLAEECNTPGSVPKSLMFILERMNRETAEDFMKLCAITITVYNESAPLIKNENNESLVELGLSLDKLISLESIGLIKMSGGFLSSSFALIKNKDDEEKRISYFDHRYKLPEDMDSFPVGDVLFTKDGYALYKAVVPTEKEGFWEETVVPWTESRIEDHKNNKINDIRCLTTSIL